MKLKSILALVLAFTLLFTFAACGEKETPEEESSSTEETQESTEAEAVETDYRNPLTGEANYEEELLKQKSIAIVVENHPSARPQWGFTTPDIVMEYEVEGGISRMLWLYANIDRVPDKVGPVRSARHDVVELAYGLGLLFVHCGGSPQALKYIKSLGSSLAELDANTYSSYFVRDHSRNVSTEHTLTASRENLKLAFENLNINTERDPETGTMFAFAPEGAVASPSGGEANHLRIVYSASYVYDFDYDADTSKYLVRINNKDQTDENGERTAYTNVIALYTKMEDLGDADHHQDLKLGKGGSGVWLSGGKYQTIKWEKPSKEEPLQLFTEEGEPLLLNVGNSYIGFVRSTNKKKTVLN